MDYPNFKTQINKYRCQCKKLRSEIEVLEGKRRKMTAGIDKKIDDKKEALLAMEKSLEKVERLQKQIADTLGIKMEETVEKKPVSEETAADHPAETEPDNQPEVIVLEEPDEDEVSFRIRDDHYSPDDPESWLNSC